MVPAMTQVIPVSAFTDNYIWLIPLGGESRRAAIVDPGEAAPVLAALDELGLEAAAILITHHHADHCGGVAELVAHRAMPVYGPARGRIRGVDHPVRDGEEVVLDGALRLSALEVPGHTLDHVAYAGAGLLLCGDTLFSAGCGRLFEGTPGQMLGSLRRLAGLPAETRLYCGHEYTVANLAFASWLEPGNAAVAERMAEARRLRAERRPTLPSTVGEELRVNPFLRCGEPGVIRAAERAAGRALSNEQEVFAVIRRLKDEFG
jgi:hydroxyacylglutathione hydrolase